jgi:hypothetical protein
MQFRQVVLGEPPIVIHQVGKVGSITMYRALQRLNKLVYHIHTMHVPRIERRMTMFAEAGVKAVQRHFVEACLVHDHVLLPGRRAKYLSVVRDPLARNVSAFFQNLWLFHDDHKNITVADVPDLIDAFTNRFDHDRVLDFYDMEFRDILGIDVYDYPFDHDRQLQRFSQDRAEVLILKTETDNHIKEEAIGDYLRVEQLQLENANVASKKYYAQAYRKFREDLRLSDSYIDRMLDARYTRHFYSDDEREKIRNRWRAAN